jgi:hypothetical protein
VHSDIGGRKGRSIFATFVKSKLNQVVLFATILINVFDRVTGAYALFQELIDEFLHLPKVIFAAVLYIITLYVDCLRIHPDLQLHLYLLRVGMAFLKVAPLYPFLAVLISFGFLFVISAFEALRLPLEWLNMPIYYGTLYGPFSLVYFNVKRAVIQEHFSLPTTMSSAATSESSGIERNYVPSSQNKVLQAALKRQHNNQQYFGT